MWLKSNNIFSINIGAKKILNAEKTNHNNTSVFWQINLSSDIRKGFDITSKDLVLHPTRGQALLLYPTQKGRALCPHSVNPADFEQSWEK